MKVKVQSLVLKKKYIHAIQLVDENKFDVLFAISEEERKCRGNHKRKGNISISTHGHVFENNVALNPK